MASKIISAATTTGTGGRVPIKSTGDHSVQVVFTGSITALTVALEGSLDGVNWGVLGSHALSNAEITAKHALFHIVGTPVSYIRINTTAQTGTGSYDVWYNSEKVRRR